MKILWLISSVLVNSLLAFERRQEIRMPNVTSFKDDAYKCHAQKLDQNHFYITHFQPVHSVATHHMLLFACEHPGSYKDAWDCGEGPEALPICDGKSNILFSWAMNARAFDLPPDLSMQIGGDKFRYLVLQIHYKDASTFKQLTNGTDNSGWSLQLQDKPTKYLAGLYTFVAVGEIKSHATTFVEIACRYTGHTEIYPVAFRVHAHSHGVLNDAYVVHEGSKFLIGSKSPQEEQTFYPVENKSLVILPGDKLVARCEMHNEEDRNIRMGHTRNDEMCNFYMMYAVKYEDERQLYDPYNQGCFPYDDVSEELLPDETQAKQTNFDEYDWNFPPEKSYGFGHNLDDDAYNEGFANI